MSDRSRARKVQAATGIPYQMALNAVTGVWVFEVRSPKCVIQQAILEARKSFPQRVLPNAKRKPCPCFECEDNPESGDF